MKHVLKLSTVQSFEEFIMGVTNFQTYSCCSFLVTLSQSDLRVTYSLNSVQHLGLQASL